MAEKQLYRFYSVDSEGDSTTYLFNAYSEDDVWNYVLKELNAYRKDNTYDAEYCAHRIASSVDMYLDENRDRYEDLRTYDEELGDFVESLKECALDLKTIKELSENSYPYSGGSYEQFKVEPYSLDIIEL